MTRDLYMLALAGGGLTVAWAIATGRWHRWLTALGAKLDAAPRLHFSEPTRGQLLKRLIDEGTPQERARAQMKWKLMHSRRG
jgi:hypothetical protein